MSFPQPNADAYAVNGGKFFRLSTPLSSPGDLYESEQGAYAFALGPMSDIANVNVAYFDPQVQTFMNQVSIGQKRAFSGLVPAQNDTVYVPAQRPGRTLLWAADLYNPSFRPPGFDPMVDIFNLTIPHLDVVQYFSPVPNVLPERTDKSYLFQNIPTVPAPGSSTYFMIPYYGRRFGNVVITNTGANALNFGLFGINFTISPATAGTDQITPLRALGALAPAAHENRKVTAPVDGAFDYLLVQLQRIGMDAALATVKVLVSDVTD